MSVYKILNDFEGCLSFFVDNIELATKMPSFRPRVSARPLSPIWNTPSASFYASENCNEQNADIPDITTWGLGYLVFSAKAHKEFSLLFAGSGEFLPVDVNGATLYIFNTLKVISDDAIDKSNAVEEIDLGMHVGTSNVIFDESVLDGLVVFKTSIDKKRYSYCVDEFISKYNELGYKGLIFEQV